ncbi:hypothetical protein HNQ99_002897 [Rhizorhapis suberifaciens]|uniref:Uncharacterized protein n=1 Tax=Rhizorhapis suberifaciens TaxID=13656 RepID=A0A840HY35_9SPHN|nr:hypothetical protein [Rhizorhapis suberifaciens]
MAFYAICIELSNFRRRYGSIYRTSLFPHPRVVEAALNEAFLVSAVPSVLVSLCPFPRSALVGFNCPAMLTSAIANRAMMSKESFYKNAAASQRKDS